MKLILSAKEFGRLSDIGNNVSLSINQIDEHCLVAPPLIETLKDSLPDFTSLNVLPNGDVELEYSEEYCLDTFELVEKCSIKALPILYVLEPVMEEFAGAIRSLVSVFNKDLKTMIGDWFKDTKDSFVALADKYM